MTEFTTIAFMGESEHGKDFCGKWVVISMGFAAVAFADPMKRLCRDIFSPFTNDILWGDPKLRNTPLEIDWNDANYRLVWSMDDWVDGFRELSIIKRAELKIVIDIWFRRLERSSEENKLSPRKVLQLLGTEYGRKFKSDLWVAHTLNHVIYSIKRGKGYSRYLGVLEEEEGGYKGAVITDCRFLNELEAVQDYGGYVVKLIRNSKLGQENSALVAGIANHQSETEISTIKDHRYNDILRLDEGEDVVYPILQRMFDKRTFVPPIEVLL